MDKIISSITNILNIDDEILTKFLGYLHPMTVPKKTILIRPLITDENVYIIEKGIARSYVMINEKEVTSWFSKEGELIFQLIAFTEKQKDMKMKGYRFWKTHCFTILKFPIWRNSVFSILKYLTGFGCCIKRHLWKWKGGLYIVYICLQKNATEIFMPKTLKYFSV